MEAPPEEAFRGYGSFGAFRRGDAREASRARGKCCSWRSHVAAILAACGALFASFLDCWSLQALRALDQPTTSGRSGLVNAASNGLQLGNDFNGSATNISGKNYSGYNDTAFNRSAENMIHFIGRGFGDVAFKGLNLNSSAISSPVSDSPAFNELALNNSANNNIPVKDSVFNHPSFNDPAFNTPTFYGQLSKGTDFNASSFNNADLNGRAFGDWALNDPAQNGSDLNDRAKNGSAINGTNLDSRAEHFSLNDRTDRSSALNDRAGNDSTLNAPDLTECGNNCSVLNDPTLNGRGDHVLAPNLSDTDPALNDSYLNDRKDNDSAKSSPSVNDCGVTRPASSTRGDNGHAFNGPAGPALHGHTGNRPFFNVGGATGNSKGSTTHAGALDGFWSFQPTLLHGMMPVGSALAAWAFGRCADRLGRRFALLSCGLVGALAWLLLLCERSSVQWVCASRILVGVQMGAIFTVFPVYVAEIAHPHSRGLASSMLCVAVALGRLLWTACGHQGLWWAGLVPLPVLAVQWLLRHYMPETPDFLDHVGRPSEAVDVRRQLHGAQSESAPETWRMERLMSPEPEDEGEGEGEGEAGGASGANAAKGRAAPRATDYVELVRLKRRLQAAARRRQQQSRRRAIAVSAGLFVLAPLAATDVLRFYVEEYIHKIGESEISMAAVIGIMEVTAMLLSAGFVDCMGRRALLFISTLGLAIIHSGLSVIAGHDRNSSPWLFIFLSGLFFAYDIGLGSVPWVVLSDMLPANGRAHLSGIIVLLHSSVISGLIYLFPIFHSNVGDKWTFISLVFISLANNIYVGHLLKETKKRTLEEIEKELEKVESSSESSEDSEIEWS